jgi:hypothetical protein
MLKSRYGTKKMAVYSAMIDRISQALKETSGDQNTVIISCRITAQAARAYNIPALRRYYSGYLKPPAIHHFFCLWLTVANVSNKPFKAQE